MNSIQSLASSPDEARVSTNRQLRIIVGAFFVLVLITWGCLAFFSEESKTTQQHIPCIFNNGTMGYVLVEAEKNSEVDTTKTMEIAYCVSRAILSSSKLVSSEEFTETRSIEMVNDSLQAWLSCNNCSDLPFTLKIVSFSLEPPKKDSTLAAGL